MYYFPNGLEKIINQDLVLTFLYPNTNLVNRIKISAFIFTQSVMKD